MYPARSMRSTPVALQPLESLPMYTRDPSSSTDPLIPPHEPPADLHNPEPCCCHCLCTLTTLTAICRRAPQHAHIAVAKSLVTPLTSFLCITAAHASQMRLEGYSAPLWFSMLGGLVGGYCLVGTVILLHIVLDITPSSGTKVFKYMTLPSLFITFGASTIAGPIGVLFVNTKHRPNSEILDPTHALHMSGLGAGLALVGLLLAKYVVYVAYRLDRKNQGYQICNGDLPQCNCDCDCHGCDCVC